MFFSPNISSLLQFLVSNSWRMENGAHLGLQKLLQLCEVSRSIRQWVCQLETPTFADTGFIGYLGKMVERVGFVSPGYWRSGGSRVDDKVREEIRSLYGRVADLIEEEHRALRFAE